MEKQKTDILTASATSANLSERHSATTFIFTLEDSQLLSQVLQIIKVAELQIQHIESRSEFGSSLTMMLVVSTNGNAATGIKMQIQALTKSPVEMYSSSAKMTNGERDSAGAPPEQLGNYPKTAREELQAFPNVSWFATTMQELAAHLGKTLQSGDDLDADHPSFKDEVYRARRKVFVDIAKAYKLGDPIPHVEYTEEENKTWGEVYRGLTKLYPTHACSTYNKMFPLLVKHCGFSDKKIPQMAEVSAFVQSRTGFRLRPISGLVDFRDFLAGLAFRVFNATMYIRHHSAPQYTPEPDICHELLGHVPLFLDEEVAQFSQEIGLASLGAPDEWIEKLGNLYWYTVEFGLCKDKDTGENRVYGGALLSSFGELQHCLTDKAFVRPLETEKAAATPYPITRHQDVYFVAEDFQDARNQLAEWLIKIPRPFMLRYNAYRESVELLYKKEHLHALVRDIQTDVKTLVGTINKIR